MNRLLVPGRNLPITSTANGLQAALRTGLY